MTVCVNLIVDADTLHALERQVWRGASTRWGERQRPCLGYAPGGGMGRKCAVVEVFTVIVHDKEEWSKVV